MIKHIYHRFPVVILPFYLRDNNHFRVFLGWLHSLMAAHGNWEREGVSFQSALKRLRRGSKRLSKHNRLHGWRVKHPPAMGAEASSPSAAGSLQSGLYIKKKEGWKGGYREGISMLPWWRGWWGLSCSLLHLLLSSNWLMRQPAFHSCW